MGALGPEQRKEPRYKVAYHTYLASGRRLSYTLSVERVVDCKYVKRSLLVRQIFAICRLRHAHVRKDTRLSPLYRTESDGKRGGAWERGYSYASNPFPMVRIQFRMLRIIYEWFDFAFQFFKTLSNGFNLHLNASNPFRMARIRIRILPITFECFESHSNASNPIRMLRISFEWFEFVFKCLQYLSNDSNFHSNALNPFEWFEFEFECFESLLNASNLHSNAMNPF